MYSQKKDGESIMMLRAKMILMMSRINLEKAKNKKL
jgi:hypothetical protein